MLAPEEPATIEEWQSIWPIKRFPVLKDGENVVMEATIIEYLMLAYLGSVRLDPCRAKWPLRTRMMDRFFDNYVMTPMQKVVFNQIRPETDRDPYGVTEAKAMLDDAYGWLDGVVAKANGRPAIRSAPRRLRCLPSLFYADWCIRSPKPSRMSAPGRRFRPFAPPSPAPSKKPAPTALLPLGAPDGLRGSCCLDSERKEGRATVSPSPQREKCRAHARR